MTIIITDHNVMINVQRAGAEDLIIEHGPSTVTYLSDDNAKVFINRPRADLLETENDTKETKESKKANREKELLQFVSENQPEDLSRFEKYELKDLPGPEIKPKIAS